MLQITPQMRILAAIEPVDFRKGIDALAQLCKQKLESDPFSGCLFLFRSRSAAAIKILVYDSQGFWIAQKRLSKGRFRGGPKARKRRSRWKRIRRRCCWPPETRRCRVRPCGGR